MMRKVLILATLLGFVATTQTKAQFPINFRSAAQDGIPAPMSPLNNVTVTRINPPIPFTNQSFCGVGSVTPGYGGYIAGAGKADGFNFAFSSGATRIRISMVDILDNDTVQIYINGAPHTLTAAEISTTPLCPAPNTTVISSGLLTSAGSPVTPTACQIDINIFPTLITSFDVRHTRSPGNAFPNGVLFHSQYWEDTCDATLLKVTDNDPCRYTTLNLTATPYPNATFNWSDGNGWTATGPNPTRPNIDLLQQGTYTVTITKGACPPIVGQTLVIVKDAPVKPTIILNTAPQCKGGTVDLDGVTTGIGGVTYYWYGPNGYFFSSTVSGLTSLTNIQPIQQGIYSLYAVSQDGCISDTTDTMVVVKPEARPNFLPTILLGCTHDTIIFNNTSTGHDRLEWYVNKVSVTPPTVNLISTSLDPVVKYIMPFDKHDVIGAPQTYELKLYAYNPACFDSQIIQIQINHPLKSEFEVDDDTICQGATLITFSNKSSTAVVSTHEYLWDFKDGSLTEDNYNATHQYVIAGEYDASLIITDYLGCKDTFTHRIFVDSTGPITFEASDMQICPGDLVNFKGNFSTIGNLSTSWEFGDGNKHVNVTNTSYSFSEPGDYPVKFSAFNRVCPDAVATSTIVVKPQPVIDLGPDTVICPNGSPLSLMDTRNAGNANATWLWNNNTRSRENNIIVRHPGVYAATVEIEGCSTTDSVVVGKNCFINLPNVFTPGSATNGYFLPRQFLSKGVSKFKMTIFNRWGKVVFESSSLDGRGWDGNFNGEPQPQGVYVYLMDVTFVNNTTEHYQGNVTMLR